MTFEHIAGLSNQIDTVDLYQGIRSEQVTSSLWMNEDLNSLTYQSYYNISVVEMGSSRCSPTPWLMPHWLHRFNPWSQCGVSSSANCSMFPRKNYAFSCLDITIIKAAVRTWVEVSLRHFYWRKVISLVILHNKTLLYLWKGHQHKSIELPMAPLQYAGFVSANVPLFV